VNKHDKVAKIVIDSSQFLSVCQ